MNGQLFSNHEFPKPNSNTLQVIIQTETRISFRFMLIKKLFPHRTIMFFILFIVILISSTVYAGIDFTMWRTELAVSLFPQNDKVGYIGFASGYPFENSRPAIFRWSAQRQVWIDYSFYFDSPYYSNSYCFDTYNEEEDGFRSTAIISGEYYMIEWGTCNNETGKGTLFSFVCMITDPTYNGLLLPQFNFEVHNLTRICEDWFYFQTPEECGEKNF